MSVPNFSAIKAALAVAGLALALSGCITIGNDFPQDAVDLIKPGQTTLDDVRKIFGTPVRTGIEDGKLTWTFARYRATIAGGFEGKDLIVRFDDQNKVVSLSFNSTDVGRQIKRS